MKNNIRNKKSRAKAKIARFFTALIVISVIVCLLITLADNLGIQFMQLLMK